MGVNRGSAEPPGFIHLHYKPQSIAEGEEIKTIAFVGKGITFDLTGPLTRQLHVAVDGRAARVESLDHPDVTVTTDSTTFIQLACGRIDPQAQIDSGAISWTGDDEIGDRAARNLRFTM